MQSLFEQLADLQSPQAARALGRQLGADEGATGNAISAALPVLIGALSRNASQPDGARALSTALSRDHDGGVLDDLLGALGGGGDGSAGEAILGHVLGSRRGSVESALGSQTGLDGQTVARLLSTLAPLVLGALGRAQRSEGLDAEGLSQALGRERERAGAGGGLELIERLLDSDGDGDVSDDLVRLGSNVLGSLFSGRGR